MGGFRLMNFIMNGNTWEIKELSQKDICEEKGAEYEPNIGQYFGVTFLKNS